MPAHVIAVDFVKQIVFTDDSRWLPITALIDEDGERTCDMREAVRFVATAGADVFVGRVADWGPRVIN